MEFLIQDNFSFFISIGHPWGDLLKFLIIKFFQPLPSGSIMTWSMFGDCLGLMSAAQNLLRGDGSVVQSQSTEDLWRGERDGSVVQSQSTEDLWRGERETASYHHLTRDNIAIVIYSLHWGVHPKYQWVIFPVLSFIQCVQVVEDIKVCKVLFFL